MHPGLVTRSPSAGLLFVVAMVLAVPTRACVGDACLNLFATEDGGGQLTTSWDFESRKVQTFESLCAAGTCLYSAIDPGFILGAEPLPAGLHVVAAGTPIGLEVVARDVAVRFRLNGEDLEPGESGLIGTAPELHNHPSWQLSVPQGLRGDFSLSFKLTTTSGTYAESDTFTILLTNLPTPTPEAPSPSPTPTATVAAPACAGDCSGDGAVTVNELVAGVGAALGNGAPCAALDGNGDGTASINELIAAVAALLNGCAAGPTPTATQAASLALIQSTIFSPRCAIPTCHDSAFRSGDLVLEDSSAHGELVGVAPDIDTAREAGLLRVDPGDPANSLLLIKLEGPPPIYGSRMPLTGEPLGADEIALIRAWIAAGAPP
jgi:hypothetical protein